MQFEGIKMQFEGMRTYFETIRMYLKCIWLSLCMLLVIRTHEAAKTFRRFLLPIGVFIKDEELEIKHGR